MQPNASRGDMGAGTMVWFVALALALLPCPVHLRASLDPNANLHGSVSSKLTQPIIERVLIDGKEFAPGKRAIASPGLGRLEVRFTVPVLSNPEQVRFTYKLEGFDADWRQADGRQADGRQSGGQRVAYYTKVPHGDYRFRVRANAGGGWVEARGQLRGFDNAATALLSDIRLSVASRYWDDRGVGDRLQSAGATLEEA